MAVCYLLDLTSHFLSQAPVFCQEHIITNEILDLDDTPSGAGDKGKESVTQEAEGSH